MSSLMKFNYCVLSPGDGSPLYSQMLSTYSRALAPGTYINRAKQAKCYVTFCVIYNVPCLQPSITAVCMFAQYLGNAFQAIPSVKNYLSGARNWVLEHGGDPSPFSCIQLDHMIKSLGKDSTHIVKRAFPLTPTHVTAICTYLDASAATPLCIKACILIGYSCYLRASNLFLPSINLLGSSHALFTRDIVNVQAGLKININSTKSRSTPYSIIVPFNSEPQTCPVTAWNQYVLNCRPHQTQPAFMLDSLTPLPSVLVVRIMRDALRSFEDVDVSALTMHSLRRGAAQSADSNGAPLTKL